MIIRQLLPVFLFLPVSFIYAATYTWDGGSGDWDTSSFNWNSGSATWPGSGSHEAVLGGTSGTITLTGPIAANKLTFNADGYLIQGDTLTLSGADPAIQSPVTRGQIATINSVIAGSGGFTKTGFGSLTLGGSESNTYTGDTIINQGSLILSKTGGATAINGNLVLYTDGEAVTVWGTADNQLGSNTILSPSGTTEYATFALVGTTQTIAGVNDPAGNGNLMITNMRSYVGSGNMPSASNNGTGTLKLVGSGTYDASAYMWDSWNTGTAIPGGKLAVDVSLAPGGKQIFTGAEIKYTGPTTINSGTLVLRNATAFVSNTTVMSGSVLELNSTAPNDSAPDMQFTATLAGDGTVNKTGTGWAHIRGAVNMSAGSQINVQDGIFSGNSSGTNWTGNQAGLHIASGAVFDPHKTNAIVGALTGTGTVRHGTSGSGTLTVGNGDATGTFDGNIILGSGTLHLTKTGTGTQTLTGTHTYNGNTVVQGGTLAIASGSISGAYNLVTQDAGTAVISDATVTVGSLGAGYGGGTGTVTVNAGGVLNAGNNGGRTFIGGGNSGGPHAQGILNLNSGGTLIVQAAGGFPNNLVYLGGYGGKGTINMDGGIIQSQRSISHGGPGQGEINLLAGGGTIDTVGSSINLTTPIAGIGGLTKTGAGTLTLTMVNSFSGGLVVNQGTLTLTMVNSFSGALVVNQGTLKLPGGNNANWLPGNPDIIINNGGTLAFSGFNSFGNTGASSKVTVNAGGTILSSNTVITFYDLTLNNATISIDGNDNYGNWGAFGFRGTTTATGTSEINRITGNGTIADSNLYAPIFTIKTPAAGDTLTVSAPMRNGTGALQVVKQGSGTLILSYNGNTYSGTTSIQEGTLIATGGNGIGDASRVDFSNTAGATLRVQSNETVGSLAGGGATGGNIVLDAGAVLSTGLNNQSTSYAGTISGAGNLAKVGSGTQTLTSDNNFTGTVRIVGGTLAVPKVENIGVVQPLGVAAEPIQLQGGTLSIANTSATNRGLMLVSPNNESGTISIPSGTVTMSGEITGGSAGTTFTKSGAGTFNQAGRGSWNGNLAVTGGTYNVTSTGSITGAGVATISGGATLNINTSTQVSVTSLNITSGTVNLDAGTLRTNSINITAGQAFNWKAATLTMYQNATGNSGNTDRTGPGGANSGPSVFEGTILNVTGSLATSSGSILDLGGLYQSGGLRYDMLQVSGSLNIAAGSTLNINYNPYFLRPSSPNEVASGDWGTLILVHADTIAGEFDYITGISNDMIGWTRNPGSITDPSQLGINEWAIEKRTGYGAMAGGDVILFHYRVAGSVPEPASAGMIIAGAMILRALMRRKK